MSRNSQLRLFSSSVPLSPLRSRKRKRAQRRWRERWRYFYLRFIRLRGTPEAIARGVAAGIFAGWFPLIATQMAFAILFAALIRGNKMVAAAATWVSNPLTSIPIYAFNFQVGRWLLRSDNQSFSSASMSSWGDMMELGTEFIADLLLGCLVVGSICAVISYFACLRLLYRVQEQRRSRRLRYPQK